MEIRRYVSNLLSSNMYLIVEGDHAVVIDPFADTASVGALNVDYIILTHEHYDHISGVNVWKTETGATVLCSKLCADNIQNPKKNLSHFFKEFCELQSWQTLEKIPEFDPEFSCHADKTFESETCIEWEGHYWNLFELPGHSSGSSGIILDGKYFFSGDSVLENYEIALGLPGGSKRKWNDIGLPRLRSISQSVHVYPGHFRDFDMIDILNKNINS